MKLERILGWIDRTLKTSAFDDVSNNGLQIARSGDDVAKVAFAVDGSLRSVRAASRAGAQLLVVHHGISWGGGIRRLVGGEYAVVKAAMDANIALAGYHLPLDANRACGNNWELARAFGLTDVSPAFSYHGNVIGVIGTSGAKPVAVPHAEAVLPPHSRVGVCSGGAGEFAVEANRLGCDIFVTGEANWGDVIAAENAGIPLVTMGHYESETYGVKALARAMGRALRVATTFVCLSLGCSLFAQESEIGDTWYAGASAQLFLPQGSSRLRRLGGGAARAGRYVTDALALECEASALENVAGLAVRAVGHFRGWEEFDRLFGYERFDPFATLGAKGWLHDGQVGPAAGLGAFYYLSDCWALRCDADVTLGLDGGAEADYSLSAGLQYFF